MTCKGNRVVGNYLLDRKSGKWRRMRWPEFFAVSMERIAAEMSRPMSWRDWGFK